MRVRLLATRRRATDKRSGNPAGGLSRCPQNFRRDVAAAGRIGHDYGEFACTNACTSETQKLLELLAATLRSLSDEDRAHLAELIQRED